MRTDLITRLRGNGEIAAIVATRTYWGKRKPKEILPAVVLHNITIGLQYTHDGDPGLYGTRVQFDLLGSELRHVLPLFDAVKAEMEQPVTVGSTSFGMSFLVSDRDIPFTDVDGTGTVGGISADFNIWWKSL